MADYIQHKRIVLAATDVAQALNNEYLEVEDLLIHSKSGNAGQIYFGGSNVNRTAGADERGVPLSAGQNLPYSYADLSRLYAVGAQNDVLLLTYRIKDNI